MLDAAGSKPEKAETASNRILFHFSNNGLRWGTIIRIIEANAAPPSFPLQFSWRLPFFFFFKLRFAKLAFFFFFFLVAWRWERKGGAELASVLPFPWPKAAESARPK